MLRTRFEASSTTFSPIRKAILNFFKKCKKISYYVKETKIIGRYIK